MRRRFPTGRPLDPTTRVLPQRSARQDALRLLTSRPLSALELRQRLLEAGHPEDEADAAIAAMRDFGYVDDVRLATAVMASAERRGRGSGWVKTTLNQRGVAGDDVAAAAVDESSATAEAELARAVALVRRRFLPLPESRPAVAKLRQRAYGFLARRGFAAGCAIRALAELQPASRSDRDETAFPDD